MSEKDVFKIVQYPFLFVIGYIAGKICDILNHGIEFRGKQYLKPILNTIKIHPFCGILIMGIIAKFVPWKIVGNMDSKTNSVIVDFAYVCLIYRGGFGLNLKELRKNFFAAARMGLIPDMLDVALVYILCTALFGMPTFIALSLGFMAMPPATGVVIPISLDFKKRGLGTDREASTLLISSCAMENICGNIFFWVMFGFVYTSPAMMIGGITNPYVTFAQTISEIAIAFVGGLIIALLISNFLAHVHPRIIFAITITIEMLVHFLLKEYLQFRLFGIIFVFTINSILRLKMHPAYTTLCSDYSGHMFEFIKFLLNAVIGASLPLESLNASDIWYILIIVFIELIHKVGEIVLISPWKIFSCKERAVFGILLASKGSAQVTLSSQIVFFEKKKANPDPDMMRFGNQAMTLGVFLLLFGLSLSSSLGLSLGLKWVKKSKVPEDPEHDTHKLHHSNETHDNDHVPHPYDELHDHHHDDHDHNHDNDHHNDHDVEQIHAHIATSDKMLSPVEIEMSSPQSPDNLLAKHPEGMLPQLRQASKKLQSIKQPSQKLPPPRQASQKI